jgi:GT2 family glycosyltransferase
LGEHLFLYANEIDHSIRILNAGYQILFSPEITAYHKNSTSSRTGTSAPYFFTRNLLWVVWKYYPLFWSLRLSLRLFYYGAKSTLAQRTGIYLRALWDACKGYPEIRPRRTVVEETCLRQIRLPIPLIFTWYK